jgi:hypothetical protein
MFAAWIVFLYTDVPSRIVFRTAGPRVSTGLSPAVSIGATVVVSAVLLVVLLLAVRRRKAVVS